MLFSISSIVLPLVTKRALFCIKRYIGQDAPQDILQQRTLPNFSIAANSASIEAFFDFWLHISAAGIFAHIGTIFASPHTLFPKRDIENQTEFLVSTYSPRVSIYISFFRLFLFVHERNNKNSITTTYASDNYVFQSRGACRMWRMTNDKFIVPNAFLRITRGNIGLHANHKSAPIFYNPIKRMVLICQTTVKLNPQCVYKFHQYSYYVNNILYKNILGAVYKHW